MTGKKLMVLYGVAVGALSLASAFFFGYAFDGIRQRNHGVTSLLENPDRPECVRGFYNEALAYTSSNHDDPPPEDDRDGDRMSDFYWEERYGLNPEDPGDAGLDPDDDGFTNLEEYRANTNPWHARHYPGVIPITTAGFDCFYTAGMGLIDDDDLLDIFISDPSEGFLPVYRDFVMIQQPDHSFVIEDAGNHEIPELTSIQSTLWLTELNMDLSRDIALIGLSEFIPNANDQIIFGHPKTPGEPVIGFQFDIVPRFHREVDNALHTFYRDLYRWTIVTEDYFDNRAPVLATVPEVLELVWFRDESENVPGDSQPLSRESLLADCGAGPVYCFDVVADARDPERFSAGEAVVVNYTETPYRVGLSDADNDPDDPDLHFLVRATFSETPDRQVKDYSVFNQDALRLARNELRNVRYSGVMFVPSEESIAIFGVLRDYFGFPVFSLGYGVGNVRIRVPPWQVWPYELDMGRDERGKDTFAMGTVYYIRRVLDYLGDRYISRPSDIDDASVFAISGLEPLVTVPPQYPERAIQQDIEGWCLVSFAVDGLGNVIEESIVVVDAEPADIFDLSSIRAISEFKYQPRVLDGQGVAVPDMRYLFRYDKDVADDLE